MKHYNSQSPLGIGHLRDERNFLNKEKVDKNRLAQDRF